MRLHCIIILLVATSAVSAHSDELIDNNAPVEPGLCVLVWNVLHGSNDVDQGPEKALAVIRSVRT